MTALFGLRRFSAAFVFSSAFVVLIVKKIKNKRGGKAPQSKMMSSASYFGACTNPNRGFSAVRCLNLKQTAVTEAAVKALDVKLPKCTLYWNGEVIQGKESK